MRGELPPFVDWNIAAVHLLQGVVESENVRVWSLIQTNVSSLTTFFARLGLSIVIDPAEGLAYLRQLAAEDSPEGYDSLPKLFRSTRLSYSQTLLCVLLRAALRRFEEEQTQDERCVVTEADLRDQWKAFFSQQGDEVKQSRDLHSTFRKLEELGFVRNFGQEKDTWEIRRILKARLTAEELELLLVQLQEAALRQNSSGVALSQDF